MEKTKIAAVVVTFNRKRLLSECLNALKNQTYQLDAIFIVDGPSTDGTSEALLEKEYIKKLPSQNHEGFSWETEGIIYSPAKDRSINIFYIKLYEDVGGAGGFYEGIKRAYEKDYEWIWLMDDDAEPNEDALEKLVDGIQKIKQVFGGKIGFACSKVAWSDGSTHKRHIPAIKPIIEGIPFNSFEDLGALIVKSSTFVSVLISRKAIEDVGLPIRQFFIWYDDIEYTERITNSRYLGLYIKNSVVCHKTKVNYVDFLSDDEGNAWKYFYSTRNRLYLFKRKSIVLFLLYLAYVITFKTFKILKYRRQGRLNFIWFNIKAAFASLFFSPNIENLYGRK
jgi:hypothetical protein